MKNLQDIFNEIKSKQKQQKEISQIYRDALVCSEKYQEVKEKLNILKEKKKAIEQAIKDDFSSELTKLEDLKLDLKTDKEMLSDIALTNLMKGQTVQVTDSDNNEYEPTFSVNFKKIN